MAAVLGVIRMGLAVATIIVGIVAMAIAALIPGRIAGVRPAAWVVVGMARACCTIFNVRVRCTDTQRLRAHQGFVFPNHCSFLDSVALLSITPLRFLAAAEVGRYPVIGWFAANLGTVFVAREDKNSRKQSRMEIIQALQQERSPALVLFPEGGLGPGTDVKPFRYGAFEMAAQNGIAYLPLAMCYSRPDIAVWRGSKGEMLLTAVWRMARFTGPMYVDVIVLPVVQPDAEDDSKQLAEAAQAAIGEILRTNAGERVLA